MATNTRVKTTLEIGVDERQVRGLEQTLERTFDPAMVEAFTRALERQQRIMEKHTKLLEKMADAGGGGGGGGGGVGGGEGSGGGSGRRAGRDKPPPSWMNRMMATSVGTMAGSLISGGYRRAQSGTAQMASGSGFVGSMVSGVPVVGPAMGGAVQGINNFYGQYAQQQQAVLGQFGRTGIGNQGLDGLYGKGAKYGLGPGAVAGAMGNYANQTGLTGGALRDVAPQLMAAQQTRGFGSLGSVLGGGGAAGGQVADPAKAMEDAIAAGFQVGIRETRMDQYLAQMGGWVESVRNQGINLSLQSATALVGVMGNLGLKGGSGMRVARNFQGAMGNIGTSGGFGQVAALRAAGLGKGTSFVQAQIFAEENPEIIMQRLAAEAKSGGVDPETASMQIRALMKSFGVNVSASEALTIAKSGGDGSAGLGAGQTASAKQKAARGEGIKGAGLTTAKTQASLERQGQGVGGKLAGTAIDMRMQEMRLAKTVLPKFAGAVNVAVDALGELITAFEGGGFGGLSKAVAKMTVQAQTVIVEELGDSFSQSTLGKEGLKNAKEHANRVAGVKEAPIDPNRRVLRMEMGKGAQEGIQVPVYADEVGGNPKDRIVHHARRLADAVEEDAIMSLPADNEINTPAN